MSAKAGKGTHRQQRKEFSSLETAELSRLVAKYGIGKWAVIL